VVHGVSSPRSSVPETVGKTVETVGGLLDGGH
jgi:hypothetical protein